MWILPFGFFAVDAILMEITIRFDERDSRDARVFLCSNTQNAIITRKKRTTTTTVTINVLSRWR